jgi:hypothetical protein
LGCSKVTSVCATTRNSWLSVGAFPLPSLTASPSRQPRPGAREQAHAAEIEARPRSIKSARNG